MAEVDVQISGSHYSPYKEQFVFTRTATLSAGETAEAYWDGIPSKEWFPTVDSVYSGQLNCLVTVTDAGSGSQAVGASNVNETNIIFEHVSDTSTITHEHTYFSHADTNMNGTWTVSVRASNQGIKIVWTAPSGANNTVFKLRCIALVNKIVL